MRSATKEINTAQDNDNDDRGVENPDWKIIPKG